MGFLDHSTNNIIVDAVLTEKGRKLLAENSLNIQGYTFGDDEVDYSLVVKYGDVVGKEKIQKNTPIFEASTSADQPVNYFLYTDTDLSDGVEQFTAQASGDSAAGWTVTLNGNGGSYTLYWNKDYLSIDESQSLQGEYTVQNVSLGTTFGFSLVSDSSWTSTTIRIVEELTLQTKFLSITNS